MGTFLIIILHRGKYMRFVNITISTYQYNYSQKQLKKLSATFILILKTFGQS